jgi:hypothetical protein
VTHGLLLLDEFGSKNRAGLNASTEELRQAMQALRARQMTQYLLGSI